MAKKTKAVVSDNPMDQLTNLIDTKIETKKEKKKDETFIPLTTKQKSEVADLISKYETKEKVVKEYEDKLLVIKDDIANPFYIKECFNEKKNIGSLFLDAQLPQRAQFIPMDSWGEIKISDTDTMVAKLGRIKKIVGDENYTKFITETMEIKIKSEITNDKSKEGEEKLSKFVKLIKDNPEFTPYFEIIKGYAVQKGALDLSFKLSEKERENLLSEVPVKTASLKVVKNPNFTPKTK